MSGAALRSSVVARSEAVVQAGSNDAGPERHVRVDAVACRTAARLIGCLDSQNPLEQKKNKGVKKSR